VSSGESGPPTRIDLDTRSALNLAIAFAVLAITVWFVRSVPRTLTALAIGGLFALALNPLVELVQRRTRWSRTPAASLVLLGFVLIFATALALITVPTIRQVRDLDDDIPGVVDDLGDLPFVGDRISEDDVHRDVEEWLDDLPERLSGDDTPVVDAVGTIADGIAAGFLTILLAAALLLDGENLARRARRLVPSHRRDDADRFAQLVYEVVGKYIAGSLLVATLAGTVMLSASLVLGVPLAPLVGAWVLMTNLIPQIGGLLGAVPFVLLGATQGAGTALACIAIFLVYQNIENHLIQPVIVGRAVSLTPPSTMVAALVGVSAGGVVGALFAVPLLGATKAVYLAAREGRFSASR